MIPSEVLTFGASSLLGGVMKLWSKKMDHERQRFEQALKQGRMEESSRIRAASIGGPWVRRLIVSSVLFSVFVAPFLVATYYPQVPVFYAYTEEKGRWLFGLFGPAMEHLKYIRMDGLVILPIHTQMAAAISGYYFGAGAAK